MLKEVVTQPIWLYRTRIWFKEAVQGHQEFLLLVVLFTSFRLCLQLVSRPQGYLLDFSDYDFYLQLGNLSDRGLYPALQYWVEYPPLFPWLAVAAYRLTEGIPNYSGTPILWFRMALGSAMLLFDVGNLVLVYWLGRRLHGPERALRYAWTYALLFTPLHVWLAWFDTMPLFFLLLATALAVGGRSSASAVVAGLGFMVKVFPILALAVVLKAERHFLRRMSLLAEAALAIVLVAAPFLVASPQYLLASFRSMVSRSPWETPWAILEEYFGYGQVAPLQDRLDPATAAFQAYPTHLPWPAITAAFAALYLLIWTRRFDVQRPANAVALTGLTVNLFLLYSRGYSPQFLVYVVPFVLLVVPRFRAVAYLVALGAINLIEFPVYGTLLTNEHWVLRDLVAFRTAMLLLLCWEYLAVLELVPSMETARRLAVTGALCGFALWGAVSLPGAANSWAQTARDNHPAAPLIKYLGENAGADAVVVFTEQWLYRELYPFLHQRTNVVLLELDQQSGDGAGSSTWGYSMEPDLSAQLAQLSTRYREIFGVRHISDREGTRLEQYLLFSSRFEATRRAGDISVSRWSSLQASTSLPQRDLSP